MGADAHGGPAGRRVRHLFHRRRVERPRSFQVQAAEELHGRAGSLPRRDPCLAVARHARECADRGAARDALRSRRRRKAHRPRGTHRHLPPEEVEEPAGHLHGERFLRRHPARLSRALRLSAVHGLFLDDALDAAAALLSLAAGSARGRRLPQRRDGLLRRRRRRGGDGVPETIHDHGARHLLARARGRDHQERLGERRFQVRLDPVLLPPRKARL